jgi:hypothetical protein
MITAAELLESLDRHFTVGCPDLSTSQLRAHQKSGVCRECGERAAALAKTATAGAVPG